MINLGKPMPQPAMVEPSSKNENETVYPSLFIDGDAKNFSDFPDQGVMTVTFRKTSHNINKTADGESHSVSLEIVSIDDVEPSESSDPAPDEDNAGAALDKLAAEKENEE